VIRALAILVLLAIGALVLPALGAGPALAADAGLRVAVFDCGRIRFDSVAEFGLSDDATEVRTLFVPCYLIEHPRGRLLWDAGLPPRFAGGEWIEEAGAGHRLDAPVSEQLAVLGLTPADVDLVAFSHFHYDHVGDANAFAGAELLIQRAEHEAAFGGDAGAAFFFPELYDALADGPLRLLDGDHDVFGDGSVRIIAAPGHTPGHQVLLLDLAETGPVLLSGDLWHFRASRRLRAVPGFNTDAEATRASMDRIEAVLAETGATLWLEHDFAFHETLARAPAWHR
jgi:glyoxylase-like metal-dependent hydrolase (beta-lactamase superfamily II)